MVNKSSFFKQKIKTSKIYKPRKEDLEKIPLAKMAYFSLILSILNILIVLVSQNNLPPEVPLFYGLARGQEQLASAIKLTLPAIISIFIIIINFILTTFTKNRFLQQALILTGFAVSFLSLITIVPAILTPVSRTI